MRRSFGFLVPILTAFVLGGIIPMPAAAQDGGKAAGEGSAQEKEFDPNDLPLPPGGPAPRLADGHPDLSGVWFPALRVILILLIPCLRRGNSIPK